MDAEQIKQTVAGIRERHLWICDLRSHTGVKIGDAKKAHADRQTLLEITDHLQKIIEAQAETIATNAKYAIELQGMISEQAAEIERLKRLDEAAEERRVNASLTAYYNKSL